MAEAGNLTTWPRHELERISGAEELQLASRRPDGSLSPHVTMWVVQAGGEPYARSARGPENPSHRRANRRVLHRVRHEVAVVTPPGERIASQPEWRS